MKKLASFTDFQYDLMIIPKCINVLVTLYNALLEHNIVDRTLETLSGRNFVIRL